MKQKIVLINLMGIPEEDLKSMNAEQLSDSTFFMRQRVENNLVKDLNEKRGGNNYVVANSVTLKLSDHTKVITEDFAKQYRALPEMKDMPQDEFDRMEQMWGALAAAAMHSSLTKSIIKAKAHMVTAIHITCSNDFIDDIMRRVGEYGENGVDISTRTSMGVLRAFIKLTEPDVDESEYDMEFVTTWNQMNVILKEDLVKAQAIEEAGLLN